MISRKPDFDRQSIAAYPAAGRWIKFTATGGSDRARSLKLELKVVAVSRVGLSLAVQSWNEGRMAYLVV
jgi:hypothetical protein